MHICNVSSDYLGFCIHLLELFQIPYTMKEQSSIYSLPFIQDFLKQVETLDGSIKQIEDMIQTMVVKNEVEQDALEKLARVYGKYRHNDTSISVFLPVLIYELKHLYLKPVRERNAVTIDSSLEDYGEHDYYFVVGFNQETMPPVSLDLDYINDEEKRELGFMDTTTKNERNKQKVIAYLQSKEDLWISYAKGSSFANFERSPLLEIIKEKRKVEVNTETSIYQNQAYNRYLLARSLDTYYKYQEKNSDFDSLFQHTFIEDYQSYQKIISSLDKAIITETNNIAKYYSEHDLLSAIGNFINNLYLIFNGNKDGTSDYDDTSTSVDTGDKDDQGHVIYEITNYSPYQKLYFQTYKNLF